MSLFQGCRGLLLPWIFVNGVTFVIFCCTLLVPLAILWFFLVKNMIEIFRDGRRCSQLAAISSAWKP